MLCSLGRVPITSGVIGALVPWEKLSGQPGRSSQSSPGQQTPPLHSRWTCRQRCPSSRSSAAHHKCIGRADCKCHNRAGGDPQIVKKNRPFSLGIVFVALMTLQWRVENNWKELWLIKRDALFFPPIWLQCFKIFVLIYFNITYYCYKSMSTFKKNSQHIYQNVVPGYIRCWHGTNKMLIWHSWFDKNSN